MQVKNGPSIGRYANGKSGFMILESNKMPRVMGEAVAIGAHDSVMNSEV